MCVFQTWTEIQEAGWQELSSGDTEDFDISASYK